MPAILTHYTFARRIYPEESLCSSLVYLGAQGPDVFFFCGYLKKRDHAKEIRHFGHHLHNIDIASVYNLMFEYIRTQDSSEDKEKLYAYLKGMMYHYALDRNAHPFIFYRTGAVEKVDSLNPGYYMRAHVLYESNLDTLLSNHYNTPKRNKDAIKANIDDVKLISKMYKYVNEQMFKYEFINNETFLISYKDMITLQKLFYSPTGLKRMLYYPLRKKVQLWVQTNPRKPFHDDEIDYLNLKKNSWKLPDTGEEREDSFFDILERAKEDTLKVDVLLELGKTKNINNELLEFTNNVNHDGSIVGKQKEYFEFCYDLIKKVPF